MRKASVGRIVLIKGFNSNGTDVQPAVITRAWRDDFVNVTVLPDCGDPKSVGSLHLFETEEAGVAAQGTVPTPFCFWPPMLTGMEIVAAS